jgi:hypothetical protein
MYLTPNFVCFHANIFGYKTTIVLPWNEIAKVEKAKTAFVIPNAVKIKMKKRFSVGTITSSNDNSMEFVGDDDLENEEGDGDDGLEGLDGNGVAGIGSGSGSGSGGDEYFFASFVTRDQAYSCMIHLLKRSRRSHQQYMQAVQQRRLSVQASNGDRNGESDFEVMVSTTVRRSVVVVGGHNRIPGSSNNGGSLIIPTSVTSQFGDSSHRLSGAESGGGKKNGKKQNNNNNKERKTSSASSSFAEQQQQQQQPEEGRKRLGGLGSGWLSSSGRDTLKKSKTDSNTSNSKSKRGLSKDRITRTMTEKELVGGGLPRGAPVPLKTFSDEDNRRPTASQAPPYRRLPSRRNSSNSSKAGTYSTLLTDAHLLTNNEPYVDGSGGQKQLGRRRSYVVVRTPPVGEDGKPLTESEILWRNLKRRVSGVVKGVLYMQPPSNHQQQQQQQQQLNKQGGGGDGGDINTLLGLVFLGCVLMCCFLALGSMWVLYEVSGVIGKLEGVVTTVAYSSAGGGGGGGGLDDVGLGGILGLGDLEGKVLEWEREFGFREEKKMMDDGVRKDGSKEMETKAEVKVEDVKEVGDFSEKEKYVREFVERVLEEQQIQAV